MGWDSWACPGLCWVTTFSSLLNRSTPSTQPGSSRLVNFFFPFSGCHTSFGWKICVRAEWLWKIWYCHYKSFEIFLYVKVFSGDFGIAFEAIAHAEPSVDSFFLFRYFVQITELIWTLNTYSRILPKPKMTLAFGNFWMYICSGLLVSYLTLKDLDKTNGRIKLVLFYVHRYLRKDYSNFAYLLQKVSSSLSKSSKSHYN